MGGCCTNEDKGNIDVKHKTKKRGKGADYHHDVDSTNILDHVNSKVKEVYNKNGAYKGGSAPHDG